MKICVRLCLLVGLLLALAVASSAATIKFAFSGYITDVSALDPNNPFPQSVEFGTPFSGSYTFDSSSPDLIPADSQTGTYSSSGGIFGITLSLAGLDLSYGGVFISVGNNYPGPQDQYFASYFENPTANKPTGVELSVRLLDFTGLTLSSDGLPLDASNLAAFQSKTLFFTDSFFEADGTTIDQVELGGQITSIETVPEPNSALLLITGLAVVGLILLHRP
jgi:hypothetical protein